MFGMACNRKGRWHETLIYYLRFYLEYGIYNVSYNKRANLCRPTHHSC